MQKCGGHEKAVADIRSGFPALVSQGLDGFYALLTRRMESEKEACYGLTGFFFAYLTA
jgi:hypothetical protein